MIQSSTRPWPLRALDEVATVAAGQSAPQDPFYFGGSNRFVRVSHLDAGNDQVVGFDLVTDAAISDLGLKQHPAGTIVFPKSGASVLLEKRAILPFDAYLVSHLAAVRGDPAIIDQDFLFFALRFHSFSDGKASGYPTLKLSEIRATEVPVPLLPEQKAIARILRTVQRAKEATEQVIGAARELKKSYVSSRVTPDELPKMWSTTAIGDVASRVEYGLSKRGGHTGLYPILRMNSISDGRVVTGDLQWVDLKDDEFRRFKLEHGDVLFNRTNSIDKVGKSAYFDLDGDWVFASYLLRVAADEAVLDPRFLNYFLGAPSTQARLKGLATRAVSQANINATKLKGLTMPVPPLPEQREIADAIQAVDAKVNAEEARRDALATLFNSLLQDLMSARLRVADLITEAV